MDDSNEAKPMTSNTKNTLPDVVHPQQIHEVGAVVDRECLSSHENLSPQIQTKQDAEDTSNTESISEHIPSKMEYSEKENIDKSLVCHSNLSVQIEKGSENNSLNLGIHSLDSDLQEISNKVPSLKIEASAPIAHLSNESPVHLAMSSELSKEYDESGSNKNVSKSSNNLYQEISLKSGDFTDLPEKESSTDSLEQSNLSENEMKNNSSTKSEEIIKIDIRGTSAPRYLRETSNIKFGPATTGSNIIYPNLETYPVFNKLISPCLMAHFDSLQESNDILKYQKPHDIYQPSSQDLKNDKSEETIESSNSDKNEQSDLLVEEILLNNQSKEKFYKSEEEISMPQPKSMGPETMSFSTSTTEYKTIVEEFTVKLSYLEDTIKKRDDLIEQLTISLQQSTQDCGNLKIANEQLLREVQLVSEQSQSEHNTIKNQLSDFIKYQTLLKDDSTKISSPLTSGETSIQSSNGEKDMEREEITIDHSRSDLMCDDFPTGFSAQIVDLVNNEQCIDVNVKNKLTENLVNIVCKEISRIQMEAEANQNQNKQIYNTETKELRELLASVKSGNVDIDILRDELIQEHKKEMESLRTYFEKKCSELQKSYTEDMYNKSGGTRWEMPSALGAAGDCVRHQTRNNEQGLLDSDCSQLKMQSVENVEASGVTQYQQDIDLELEKNDDIEKRLEEVRQEVISQLQDQLKVLLADPDADLTSWPVDLVALREKIQCDSREQELSSLETATAEPDKCRQRRNRSFDQNRQLEEVTKERDGLKRCAVSLSSTVGELLAYFEAADQEINNTVLANLLQNRSIDKDLTISRPTTPDDSDVTPLELTSSSRHVHFAPNLSVLPDLDEVGISQFLVQQKDLSLDIRRELEHSLKRLRREAHNLLELCAVKNKVDVNDLPLGSPVKITELVEQIDSRQRTCDNCDIYRKTMEEAMAECQLRENFLGSDLEGVMLKLSQMATDKVQCTDIIAEGYGLQQPLSSSRYVPRPAPGTPPSPGYSDALKEERDDLIKQLEAANHQLRSTRRYMEDQAAERETERESFDKQLAELSKENAMLATRLQTNARIMNEVEQLEIQTREMNQIISDLEARKAKNDKELKESSEKISHLSEIIASLEEQLDKKTSHESEILCQLEEMKRTIDERDSNMRNMLGELESLKSEKADQSLVVCTKCTEESVKLKDYVEQIKNQVTVLEESILRHSSTLERSYEPCSNTCSENTEDVSLREHKKQFVEVQSPEATTPRCDFSPELSGLSAALSSLWRVHHATVKRVKDGDMQRVALVQVAQEVRAERDVLQARMSEQALRLSSLSARLEEQRNNAEATMQQERSRLSVRLHDATAEVQRLKEEIESRDKQIVRLKQNIDERDNTKSENVTQYRSSGKEQCRIAQLETLVKALEKDKEELNAKCRELQRNLAEKEEQLEEILALQLEYENKEEKCDIQEGGKTSARTLSDIVSISEFDEQDLQMRRTEFKQNLSLSNVPLAIDNKSQINKTLPPDLQKPNMSSLNLDHGEHFEIPNFSPRADSLPAHLTSTQNKDISKYKRNVNEVTAFGVAQNIPDNCSMYPNRDVNDFKNISVEPKKIDFSIEPSQDNKTQPDELEFTSLRELGIILDIRQENFPDILTQLKYEIKKSKTELESCKSNLKNAQEQLCEFPALKEEVEELKGLLENTMATMDTDKKYYEKQLKNFSNNKNSVEQELADKIKDYNLLKKDLTKREEMIIELAKEKRNLANKSAEIELKIDELQSRNAVLEKNESENLELREKIKEFQKLKQLVLDKNQQIDSLNQHLDRLDDMQRNLDDKTEELENLKESFEEKSSELFQLQDTIEALKRDIANINEENDNLNTVNKDLKLKLTKLEKEQENSSLRLQNSETELKRINSLNTELRSKIEELKGLNNKVKDKETEIEILHEDMNAFHEEIASLKEQLKIMSRSPSPKNKSFEDKKATNRQTNDDKKQLSRIRKQISLLQHELDFNKRELNDKAFELAKAKLDVTELKSSLSDTAKLVADKDLAYKLLFEKKESLLQEIDVLKMEKKKLSEHLEMVIARVREESNVSELKTKLQQQVERCHDLELELQDLKDLVDRLRQTDIRDVERDENEKALVLSGTRSPTAELEMALKDQLNYSHRLDEDIMEQILSGSSDEREDIPRLALNSSKSTSSLHSSSSDRVNRLRIENDKLSLQLSNLEARMHDKDALINELNRVRQQMCEELQEYKMQLKVEKDSCECLKATLVTQQETADNLQIQDANMIQILKKRLESSMQSEQEMQQQLQQARSRYNKLERKMLGEPTSPKNLQLDMEIDNSERLSSEVSILKSKLDMERIRNADLQATAQHSTTQQARELAAKQQTCAQLNGQIAQLQREKHDLNLELMRCNEKLSAQTAAISELEKKLSSRRRIPAETLTEIETHKSELAREISALKQCISETNSPQMSSLKEELFTVRQELNTVRQERKKLEDKLAVFEKKEHMPDERDQAIRFLHGRCLRLESCRKGLVWQKRYLQKIQAGYGMLERNLQLPSSSNNEKSRGLKRFKCVALAALAIARFNFLVRRSQKARAVGAVLTPNFNISTPQGGTSISRRDFLTRRMMRQDLRLNTAHSPGVGEYVVRSPFNVQRDDAFILSTPRTGAANACLNKLELVSRCLEQTMEAARHTP